MSLRSRREYLLHMGERYQRAKGRAAKSAIIDEVVQTLGYHRKHVIRAFSRPVDRHPPRRPRQRRYRYTDALYAIQLVWEALDYCCAERLHPVLLPTAQLLAKHGVMPLTPQIEEQLSKISRATLARRLGQLPSARVRRTLRVKPKSGLVSTIPINRYPWDESRPGALEVDLVEHNGGSSSGHYAYTVSVVDVVTGWGRRRAVLGHGQATVHKALSEIVSTWPIKPWDLHTDNGSEFLNGQLVAFARVNRLDFSRSRPYHKNDSAHVEQKNRQYIREIVGHARFDTPQGVAWLNRVYDLFDPYANLFLPSRKVVFKAYRGSHVSKKYDTARSPFRRLCDLGALDPATRNTLEARIRATNPLALHRALEELLDAEPRASDQAAAT